MDVRNEYLKSVDFVIAALHDVVMRSVGKKGGYTGPIGALHNPHVDMLAHPDSPSYMLDYEAIVKAAAWERKNCLKSMTSLSVSGPAGSPMRSGIWHYVSVTVCGWQFRAMRTLLITWGAIL